VIARLAATLAMAGLLFLLPGTAIPRNDVISVLPNITGAGKLWEPVPVTPWDMSEQMYLVRPIIEKPVGKTLHYQNVKDWKIINRWLAYLSNERIVKYEPQPIWHNPQWTMSHHRGDCKCKSLVLYSEMRKKGIPTMLVVGRLSNNDDPHFYHAWVVWLTPKVEIILDPTDNNAKPKINRDPNRYIAWYGFVGSTKFHRIGSPWDFLL
jgi:hypothetical protein